MQTKVKYVECLTCSDAMYFLHVFRLLILKESVHTRPLCKIFQLVTSHHEASGHG